VEGGIDLYGTVHKTATNTTLTVEREHRQQTNTKGVNHPIPQQKQTQKQHNNQLHKKLTCNTVVATKGERGEKEDGGPSSSPYLLFIVRKTG
jgi:hypothetical protein